MFFTERYLDGLIKVHRKNSVFANGGTWYPMVCKFLKLKYHIHSPFEKSIIGRTVQYMKDRTENFDDYFPCRRGNCKLKHAQNWLRFFVDHHNREIKPVK